VLIQRMEAANRDSKRRFVHCILCFVKYLILHTIFVLSTLLCNRLELLDEMRLAISESEKGGKSAQVLWCSG
jgi:hypothetical protein